MLKAQIKLFTSLFFLVSFFSFAQTAKVLGVVLDENKEPVEGVTVSYQKKSVITNATGFYAIEVPAEQKAVLIFSHTSLKNVTVTVQLKSGEKYEFNPVMNGNVAQLNEVVITGDRKRVQGITNLDPEVIRKIPGAMPGVENILKSLGSTSGTTEGSEYSARGGNYDENLVYVNDVEIYRPFLIRSGQQEGLSFTNTDLVQNVDFSAGGFQAKYGDKMSSVLDITYRKPKKFGASLNASLLGGSMSLENISKNKKWSYLTGVRYRNNSLLVKSQQTQTNYHPSFADVQMNINYNASEKWQWSFLGNIAQNNYNYQPLSRQTNFGTLSDPIALQIFYEGQEKDKYQTYFGSMKSTFLASKQSTYKFIASAYHTQEQEHYDIDAAYYLGEVDTNIGSETFGNVTFSRGIGSQLNHARNDLDALIANAEVKGTHFSLNKRHQIDWGIKYTHESIRDRVVEWEVIDSAGFSVNPPIIDPQHIHLPENDQPYNAYVGPLVPYKNVRALNFVNVNRFSSYAQWNTNIDLGEHKLYINAGIRSQSWEVSGDNITTSKMQTVVSPRTQFTFKPAWEKNIVFRLATGLYYQPPSYREMRDANGIVNPDLRAQKSLHFVAGSDYNFKMWKRPFKFVAEAFYKDMTAVNTYTIDNVRIRYRANNDAVAYAYGFDCRLNGEFVPGTESWFSFGYLKTEENQDGKGYIARPTDQRLKFGVLFQDYMPNIPSVKLYLNLTYNTGLPGGSPSYANPYDYQGRLRDYRRADVGFSYLLTEKNNERPEGHWLKKFNDLSIGLEIFNLFNNQNAITNTWVRDVYTKNQYAIPNYMTTRVFNIKLTARL
ncbi:carboxypeptidase-like regulatory domain-containing protein [Flavobacterium sp. SUN046]|uniref:TonB-dependent receptor n=1 Tax=Flavobacterium sp. SUN046 TaxID=3002440 RepID=UPI002DBC76CE|nr:carboxypeptidase-like regulatory domain-containing protein [Flavobacterium sp. SUN046]MEC4049349.1 carboxypeptidase-like regulatory domain-containing protein [Flavobacterium sp. SUN046]